jgi:hypothetical protein
LEKREEDPQAFHRQPGGQFSLKAAEQRLLSPLNSTASCMRNVRAKAPGKKAEFPEMDMLMESSGLPPPDDLLLLPGLFLWICTSANQKGIHHQIPAGG